MNKIYKSKVGVIPGTSYKEVLATARKEHHAIQKRTPRRQAYVRSKYFRRDKVFVNRFWVHLEKKSWRDRSRRVKLFPCAIDLIRHTTFDPEIKLSTTTENEVLYRFMGASSGGEKFCVQIKEDKRSGRKDFISVFPK